MLSDISIRDNHYMIVELFADGNAPIHFMQSSGDVVIHK